MTSPARTRSVLVIGNRSGALREMAALPELAIAGVFAVAGSPLDREVSSRGPPYPVMRFTAHERQAVIERIAATDFDLLVSHGCPFVLPVTALARPAQRFINLHPSPLPRMRGRHPANGVLLRCESLAGATLHDMADRVDAGKIIAQRTFEVTPDIDLGLLYRLVFDLEARVFVEGMRRLIASDFEYEGEEQVGPSSYYSRRAEDMRVDLASMSDGEILTRVRAFGVPGQGVGAEFGGRNWRVFDAEAISNSFVLEKYSGAAPGTLLLEYDGRRLVKSRDGVIKIRLAESL